MYDVNAVKSVSLHLTSSHRHHGLQKRKRMTESKTLRIGSWNVNGLQSCLKKDANTLEKQNTFVENNVISNVIKEQKLDVMCLQETRCAASSVSSYKPFEHTFMNQHNLKSGQSGTLVSSNTAPLAVFFGLPGIGNEEGRVITFEFEAFYLVNVYTPNIGRAGERLQYRITTWEPAMRKYLNMLQSTRDAYGKEKKAKEVVVVGDINCIPEDIDSGMGGKGDMAGATPEEKACFRTMLDECKMTDAFRYLHPDTRAYSWFSPWDTSFSRGVRLDFCLVSEGMKTRVKKCEIHSKYRGSDHVPVVIEIEI